MNKTETTCFGFYFDNTREVFITNILICILNVMFSIITCVDNSTILLAIKNTQDLHTPSYVLLGCLTFSDLLVGLICQPLFVGVKIAEFERSLTVYCWLRMLLTRSGWTTAGVSFLIVAAVSVDRLIALHLHLRYSAFVTVSRVLQATLVIWILSVILCVVLRFWMMTAEWFFIPLVIFVVVSVVLTVSTMKIFRMVRRHQRQIKRQTEAWSTFNPWQWASSNAENQLSLYFIFTACLWYVMSLSLELWSQRCSIDMQSRNKSLIISLRRHLWVQFVAGSLPCTERFFSGWSGFPLSSSNTTLSNPNRSVAYCWERNGWCFTFVIEY